MMGVKRALMVQDVMPDAAVELGMLRNTAVIAISRRLARAIYNMADEIFTLWAGNSRSHRPADEISGKDLHPSQHY